MMAEKHKHVMYLITEDRDILKAVFAESADTLKGYLLTGAGEGFGNTACGKVLQTANRDSFYRVAQTNGILADAYEVFDLKERDYFADSAGESPVQKIFHVLSQSRKAFYGSITFLCIHALQGDTSPLCILIFASGPLPLY